jgi:hypothetical protein
MSDSETIRNGSGSEVEDERSPHDTMPAHLFPMTIDLGIIIIHKSTV